VADVNLNVFTGRLTHKPEFRTTPQGHSVASFTIANNGFKEGDVAYLDFTAWGRDAEYIRDNVTVGDQVHVQGTILQQNWTDKETGKNRSKLVFRLERFKGLRLKKWDGQDGEAPARTKAKAEDPPFDPDADMDDEENIRF
jgi:single-strand DNA-binding protein